MTHAVVPPEADPIILTFPPNAGPIALTLLILGWLVVAAWFELRKPVES